jgi:hypothetical protein
MSRRILGIVVINVVLFCVLAELLALAVYYVENGAVFYTHRKAYPRILESEEGRLTGDALHPYFGPTHQPGMPFDIPESLKAADDRGEASQRRTNNFGFVSPHDYPFVKTNANQYVIGLFGGSVGVWFCQLGVDRLVGQMKHAAFFRDKELVPLCFSHEGYKQPQHMLILGYFLSIGQPFDLVINIDGFNEVALGALNSQHGVDISMPSFQHMTPLINVLDQSTLTPEKLRSLAAIDADRERLKSSVERIQRTRSAAVWFVLDRLHQRTLNDYRVELGRFSNLPSNRPDRSVVRVTPAVKPREGAGLFRDIADNWVRSSVQMNQMLADRGVPYFHFLQPNQYRTTRSFTESEARVALSGESPFKAAVEQGYPLLTGESGADALRRQLRFFDATHAFDGESSPVYMDNCCHYTLTGNHRLADFVAASILGSTGPWRR